MKTNVKTMKFYGIDDWNNPTYKCVETGILYKDLNYRGNPDLYSCGNCFDGEPCFPINSDFEIHFIDKYQENPHKFDYMMLSRLKSDCDYYLGNGDRYAKQLWAGNEVDQIKEMKKIYNSFPDGEKPEWLTMEQIQDYEKQMVG